MAYLSLIYILHTISLFHLYSNTMQQVDTFWGMVLWATSFDVILKFILIAYGHVKDR